MDVLLGWMFWGLLALGFILLIPPRTRTAGFVIVLTFASIAATFFSLLQNVPMLPLIALILFVAVILLVVPPTRIFALAMSIGFVVSWCLYTTICGAQGQLFRP